MRAAITLAAVGTAATALSLVGASHDHQAANHLSSGRRHHAKAALDLQERAIAAAVPPSEQELAMEKRGTYSGSATFYYVNTGNQGSCGGYLNPWEHTVALNEPMYGDLNSESSWCNKKIVISSGGKQTTATIRDACPESDETCHYGSLDMSISLFTFFNPTSVGVFPIKWWPAGEDGGDSGPTPAEKAAAKAAAAKKAAAAAAAAAAERKKESIASKSSKSAASVKSVKSVKSSKSHYSHTKSVASVKSVSSKSAKSVKSVASVASVASKSSAAAAKYAATHKPNNLQNLAKVQKNLKNLVQQQA